MTTIKGVLIQSSQVSPASTKACRAIRDCTRISPRFLSWRSMKAPANGPTTSCGIKPQKAVIPSKAADPVNR